MDEREVGMLTSVDKEIGVALLQLDAIADGKILKAGEALLVPHRPDWMQF